jgi:hypothetical protein
MKHLKTLLIQVLLFSAYSAFAQQKKSLFQKTSIDSLNLITPIVDAKIREDWKKLEPDTLLQKEIKSYIVAHIMKALNKTTYIKLKKLEAIDDIEYSDITHNYLSYATSRQNKELRIAPKIVLTQLHKYSLLISVSGYHGNTTQNSIFVNFTVINNHTRQIIYTQMYRDTDYPLNNKSRVLAMLDDLIKNYKN